MANDQFKTFSINLNAHYVNGMTPFDLVRLLDTLESVKPQIIPFFKIKLLLRLLKHSFDYHKSQQTYFSLAQKLLFLENFYDMSTN